MEINYRAPRKGQEFYLEIEPDDEHELPMVKSILTTALQDIDKRIEEIREGDTPNIYEKSTEEEIEEILAEK